MSDDSKIAKSVEKIFVLDTNVLVYRPDAFLSFKESTIVIPLWVLEELDRLKKEETPRGQSARAAVRQLNELGRSGNLKEGVKLSNSSTLKTSFYLAPHQEVSEQLPIEKMDNKIILCALFYHKKGSMVFFVSKDINARVKAGALGMKAVDYEKQKVDALALYSGCRESIIGEKAVELLLKEGSIEPEGRLEPNEYLILKKSNKTKTSYLGKFDKGKGRIAHIESGVDPVMGIKPLNIEQRIAFDLLLDANVALVTIVGKAGTGKTLLALAAGLEMVSNQKLYRRALVSRPVIPMGKDIGYLPGAKHDKMSHWMQPIFDNLELIIQSAKSQSIKSIDQLINNKSMEIEALTYIRGRSLPNQYIIIDEAQNLSPHEVKTVVSRAGEGTKVVLTGDPYQIDSPYLDENSNGLSYLVEAFKGEAISGHITLTYSERSLLAERAAELL